MLSLMGLPILIRAFPAQMPSMALRLAAVGGGSIPELYRILTVVARNSWTR